jgi:hypothetical protein
MKLVFASSFLLLLAVSVPAAEPTPRVPDDKTTSPPTQPDNAGINKRDRDDAKPTPEDQAKGDDHGDPTDVAVLTAIRRAITKDDSISINGHNVKIIVKGGASGRQR